MTGPGDRNLSKRRARSVGQWLVQAGIASERLEAAGCGESRPLDKSGTPDANKLSRRVEFHLVDPACANADPATECDRIPLDAQ